MLHTHMIIAQYCPQVGLKGGDDPHGGVEAALQAAIDQDYWGCGLEKVHQ